MPSAEIGVNTVRVAAERMRARWEIVLIGSRSAADLRAAGEAALDEIRRVELLLSAFDPATPLFQVNQRASDESVRVPHELLLFLERARELSSQTHNTFDPTVGPLLEIWGFRGAREMPPSADELDSIRGNTGWQNVVLDREKSTVRFVRPGAALDAGAIGKGYALERAAELLRESGIRCALLHGGTSSVAAIGAPPDSPAGWPIAIPHPVLENVHLAHIYLRNAALSVSAPHGRRVELGGEIFGHVLDPRTGAPAARGAALAAVVCASATETDALSTALLVGGIKLLPALAEQFPGAGFLVAYAEPDESLRIVTRGAVWQRDSPEFEENVR